VFGAFGGGDDCEQGVGEHREQGPGPQANERRTWRSSSPARPLAA
jgi:hypothetical protein